MKNHNAKQSTNVGTDSTQKSSNATRIKERLSEWMNRPFHPKDEGEPKLEVGTASQIRRSIYRRFLKRRIREYRDDKLTAILCRGESTLVLVWRKKSQFFALDLGTGVSLDRSTVQVAADERMLLHESAELLSRRGAELLQLLRQSKPGSCRLKRIDKAVEVLGSAISRLTKYLDGKCDGEAFDLVKEMSFVNKAFDDIFRVTKGQR